MSYCWGAAAEPQDAAVIPRLLSAQEETTRIETRGNKGNTTDSTHMSSSDGPDRTPLTSTNTIDHAPETPSAAERRIVTGARTRQASSVGMIHSSPMDPLSLVSEFV
jgi:hypothetical protein